MEKHKILEKHRGNVVKQATQIRQCLIQAREYKDAADVTSLATRPLLLYYSLMSLALAQILFKGSGVDSLDAARGEHAHHGLTFTVSSLTKGDFELTAASHLIAKPMIAEGRRRGTFELWHRTAREDPVVGERTRITGSGSLTSGAEVFLISANERLGYIAEQGMNFFECLSGTPGMLEWLGQQGVGSDVIRGSFSTLVDKNAVEAANLIIHPGRAARVQEIADAVVMHPSLVSTLELEEYTNGFTLHIPDFDASHLSLPKCCMWNNKEIRFLPKVTSLNEFGYFYVGLYILGNYARYYPDRWMVDVETGSILALAAEEFMAIAEWRMALLTLSELSEFYFVCLA